MEMNILPAIPRLHTALAEWAACAVLIVVFQNRIKGGRRMILTVCALVLQGVIQVIAGMLPLSLWIPGMLVAVAAMYLWIYILCSSSAYDAAYNCVRAFVLAEFAASLEWQIHCFMVYGGYVADSVMWEVIIMVAVYGAVYVIIYLLERRFYNGEVRLGVKNRELVSAVIIGTAAFIMSNIGFVYANTPFSARFDVEMFIVRTVMNFGGLAVLYTHYIIGAEMRAEKELDAIRNVLQRQYSQYQLFQENNELLNMKYHDLKNQLGIIRAETDAKKRESYLDDMDRLLQVYEAKNETENQVLDTVLDGKKLLCIEYGIELTTVVNGRLLEFMDAMDICTIFGNALDNAIECEKKIDEIEKRMIHVSVFSKKNFLMIRVENYFPGELQDVVQGIPATTKPDKRNHGYGLKSIQYSARKYGGSVTIVQKDDWFILKILIPIS